MSKELQLFLELVGHGLTHPSFLPVVRQQVCQVKPVTIVIYRYPGKNISQPFTWIYILCFAGFYKGVNDGGIFSRIMVTTEKKILSLDGHSLMLILIRLLSNLYLPPRWYRDTQFAKIIGRARLYQNMPNKEKKDLPLYPLMDSQVNLVVKDYYSDESFCRNDMGNINLWKLLNLFSLVQIK